MTNEIKIYTDGSSLGNPGPGGWGVVVISSKQKVESSREVKEEIIKELGGFEKNTTNNRMELQAVIETLKYIQNSWNDFQNIANDFTIFSDSNYVLSGITSWIYNWEKNGWRTANKKEVLNQDLWKELIALIRNADAKIKWEKVKGHSGHVYNDRADEIATNCASRQKRE